LLVGHSELVSESHR